MTKPRFLTLTGAKRYLYNCVAYNLQAEYAHGSEYLFPEGVSSRQQELLNQAIEELTGELYLRAKDPDSKRPSRSDLIAAIERIQAHVSNAAQYVDSEGQDDIGLQRIAIDAAFAECLEARKFDPPR